MRPNILVPIAFTILLIISMSHLVVADSMITTLSDDTSEKFLVLNNTSPIVYLKIPKNSNVINAVLKLSGNETNLIIDPSYEHNGSSLLGCEKSNVSVHSGRYAAKCVWGDYGYSAQYLPIVPNMSYRFEYWYRGDSCYYNNFVLVGQGLSGTGKGLYGTSTGDLRFFDDWQKTEFVFTASSDLKDVPGSDGVYSHLTVGHYYQCEGNDNGGYIDDIVLYADVLTINSPSIDVGNDGDYQWNYSGEFNTSETLSDFSSEINEFLINCTSDANRNCMVPLVVSSNSPSAIKMSNINILYQIETLLGNISDVSTNIDNLTMFVDNSTHFNRSLYEVHNIEFKKNNETVVAFEFDFSSDVLDLNNITIEKQSNVSANGSLLIRGINLPPGKTKTVYVDNIANVNSVCVKDMEIVNITEISSSCNGLNEILVTCDNNSYSGYACNNLGTKYEIVNLTHSGIIEYARSCSEEDCIKVDSPVQGMYNKKTVLLNVSTDMYVSGIYSSFNGNRWIKLCSNCISVTKNLFSKEGNNNVKIKAIMYNNSEIFKDIRYSVDTIKPKIINTEPDGRFWTNGVMNFYVKFTEANIRNVFLNFSASNATNFGFSILDNCSLGINSECTAIYNLSYLNGFNIKFKYVIMDDFYIVSSRETEAIIDSTAPTISIFSPTNSSYTRTPIRITALIGEQAKLEYSDNDKKFLQVCMSCFKYNSTRTFTKGSHNLVFRATDKSGNTGYSSVSFTVM